MRRLVGYAGLGLSILIAGCAGAQQATAQPPVAQGGTARTAAMPASTAELPAEFGVPAPHLAPNVIGSLRTMRAVSSDTLLDIAYENGLGFVELVAANPGVDPWLPGEGTRVTLPGQHILPDAPREGIVINLAEMRLYYFPPDGGMVRTYPVGIGRGGLSTPTGTTQIRAKVPKPTWYPTERMRRADPSLPAAVPAGPDNPLGDYALDLGWPAYLIHGTNNKWGIGRRISSGCIRLYPAHIADLFERVTSGTTVTVVDQPIKFAWAGGHLYVEAHTTQTQAEALEETGGFQPDPDLNLNQLVGAALGERRAAIDLKRLKTAVAQRRGVPVRITRAGAS
jgi:L,D-transpeptidase ErfK/SrfK